MWGWISEVLKGLAGVFKIFFGADKPVERKSDEHGVPTPVGAK